MEDLETKKEFILLRAKGKSLPKIAVELGVSKRTLVNWTKEFREEIIVQRQIEEDGLRELVRVDQKNKIDALEQQWAKLKDEVNRRNLTLMPTHHVFDQFAKFSDLLRSETGSGDSDFADIKSSPEREELHKALFDDTKDDLV